MDLLHQKQEALKRRLLEIGSVLVAFSSGVDSTFLLKTAHDLLGDKAVAITARSSLFPAWESREAEDFCKAEGIRQILITHDEMRIEGFKENPENRCYLCKRALFTKILDVRKELGLAAVVEGSNLDDDQDYRPGRMAIRELHILSPLHEAGLTKAEIRALSKELGLPTWEKPSFACLASRFVYGETITPEGLHRVEKAERYLLDQGFRQMRVRVHGRIARIEVLREDFGRMLEKADEIHRYFRELGFTYVTMDLGGFSSGSMNRTIGSRPAL